MFQSIYRSTGSLLKEEQAKEAKLEVRKYRDKPRETNLSFFWWFARTLFYRRADTSPCPGTATTSVATDASYTTNLFNARKKDVLEEGEAGN